MLPTLGDALQESWKKYPTDYEKRKRPYTRWSFPWIWWQSLMTTLQTQISKFLSCLGRTCNLNLGHKGGGTELPQPRELSQHPLKLNGNSMQQIAKTRTSL
jgi:hypothetical protein